VIEVKPLDEEILQIASTPQVGKYWTRYRLVLVTNYREFVLIGEDAQGRPARLESFTLASSENAFWNAAATPRATAGKLGRSFDEYLIRALTQNVSLGEPKDVAWFLASYARDALGRVEGKGDLPALKQVRQALEAALGISFEGRKGDHFFHSTLVQTLFYGIFSAWVLWARDGHHVTSRFDWRLASWYLKVPMLSALFSQLAQPSRLGPLGLVEVLDWTADTLNRVSREVFFAKFEEAHAVQYFYEPFLAAFDPELRKELGVWYTPIEVVQYMVERVDRSLRDDLGIADGLADECVHVLDPCCGTGSYLAEVLRRIDRTLADRGLGALKDHKIKEAALKRVHGFEIMPAPFVVSHLQIGLLLRGLQAPLAEDGSERASVYLTNALTGWSDGAERQIEAFPEFATERELAAEVKREEPILVVTGNPPYNGFAGVVGNDSEERALTTAYRQYGASARRKVRA
jgi:N-6 DNA Methylase